MGIKIENSELLRNNEVNNRKIRKLKEILLSCAPERKGLGIQPRWTDGSHICNRCPSNSNIGQRYPEISWRTMEE